MSLRSTMSDFAAVPCFGARSHRDNTLELSLRRFWPPVDVLQEAVPLLVALSKGPFKLMTCSYGRISWNRQPLII